ncbi:hypothetical protein [Bacillus halotolerans]|uniref:hypothetical protein n=1 Tax=Bacillus halotolerans TaxID=260554 RepID=UPI00192C6552|nr:hypothetical protein [Bacillus halotolerans]MBL4969032.1 hypothetical protein [Bacillus halotolerans]MBL4973095.1 hypothetical protein [Bacillus halotolerans]
MKNKENKSKKYGKSVEEYLSNSTNMADEECENKGKNLNIDADIVFVVTDGGSST